MGVDMKVKAIYDSEIGNITRSEKNWKDVLKVAGQLYRYEFDNIVMVTAQRPPEKSTLMADYDTWKKVGRYVKRGAKGCAKGCGEKIADQKECSVAERDDGIPVIVVAAVKETIS